MVADKVVTDPAPVDDSSTDRPKPSIFAVVERVFVASRYVVAVIAFALRRRR
jgi:hypothetical protein